jgi:hypothetical protein
MEFCLYTIQKRVQPPRQSTHYVALLDNLKQQLISKRPGKLSKGILFLQDNAAPQKVAITHKKSYRSLQAAQ